MPAEAVRLLNDPANELFFSPASLWEVVIKNSLGRADFKVDPHLLRRGLMDNGYRELSITSAHAVAIEGLPPIHKDPFDRILVAQAIAPARPKRGGYLSSDRVGQPRSSS